jgi:hypothetical protein
VQNTIAVLPWIDASLIDDLNLVCVGVVGVPLYALVADRIMSVLC